MQYFMNYVVHTIFCLLLVSSLHSYLLSYLLLFQDVSVDDSFVDLLAEIKEQRELRVIHGIVLRHDEITKGPRLTVLDTDDPVAILFEYMKQKNLRLIDLLHNLDRDHSDSVSRDEFQRGMTVGLNASLS